MLTCKEVSVLLSQAQDRRLGWREKLALVLHLKLCEGCANFRQQLDFIRAAARRYYDRGDPR
jgi:hypothetical protein